MRIAILSHFQTFQPGYALHVGWLERARMLDYFGQDFDFLVNTDCHELLYPNQVSCLGKISSDEPLDKRAEFFETQYLKWLKDYDAIFTADMIYQRKGNFLAQNLAMRRVASKLKAHWYHWIHSSWVQKPKLPIWPSSLRYSLPPKSTAVYMNNVDRKYVAEMLGTDISNVACVYNTKDPRSFFDFHPKAWLLTKTLKPWDKDIIQIFPHCSTRMDAKGIDIVLKTFAALKNIGAKVALVLANANGGKRANEIHEKIKLAESLGLVEDEDFAFTSEYIGANTPFPRRAVANWFQMANVFVFASWSEVSPQVLLEAKTSGCLLAVSNRLPVLREFAGERALFFDASYRTPGLTNDDFGNLQEIRYTDEEQYFDWLARQILSLAKDNRHMWEFSFERIWTNQLRPLLYGEEKPKVVVGIISVGEADAVDIRVLADKCDFVVVRVFDEHSDEIRQKLAELTNLEGIVLMRFENTEDWQNKLNEFFIMHQATEAIYASKAIEDRISLT